MYDGVNFDIKSISVTILLKIPKMNIKRKKDNLFEKAKSSNAIHEL